MSGICRNCGKTYNDGAKFCTECGVDLSRFGEVISETNSSTVSFGEASHGGSDTVKESMAEDGSADIVSKGGEKVENSENQEESQGVYNTYGAANPKLQPPYTGPYGGTPNGNNQYGNHYGGTPNGNNQYGNPYGGTPNGNSQYGNPYGGTPNGNNQYGNPYGGTPNGNNQYGNPYGGNGTQRSRTLNLGMLIFSIINIVLGCCSCVGIIFGGAGVAFTLMAQNAQLDEDEERYIKIALVLNVLGIALAALVVATVIIYGISG